MAKVDLLQFEDTFWEADILKSLNGFNVISNRLKDGKSVSKCIAEFLKKRSQIEEDYAAKLKKLVASCWSKDDAKSAENSGEIRESLNLCWTSFRESTANVADVHRRQAAALSEQSEKMTQAMGKWKTERRKVKDPVKKAHANVKQALSQVKKAQEQYYKQCRRNDEVGSQESSTKSGRTSSLRTHDDREAAVASRDKSTEARPRSETCDADTTTSKQAGKSGTLQQTVSARITERQLRDEYKKALASLGHALESQERQLVNAFRALEAQEKERLRFTRTMLWCLCNLGSEVSVDEDTQYESARKQLEGCSVSSDLQAFIAQRQTGTKRPEPLQFQEFASRQTSGQAKPAAIISEETDAVAV